MTSSLDLASLLCSRLCHDMLSPVGALNNGLELLADEKDPEMRQRCLELLEQSARISANKLKFFRLAYGAAGGFGEQVPVEEPHELLASLTAADERLDAQLGGDANRRCPSRRSRCCSISRRSGSMRWCAAARCRYRGGARDGADRNRHSRKRARASPSMRISARRWTARWRQRSFPAAPPPAHMIRLLVERDWRRGCNMHSRRGGAGDGRRCCREG